MGHGITMDFEQHLLKCRRSEDLKMFITVIDYRMRPNGLRSLQLVFGALPNFPCRENINSNLLPRFNAIQLARAQLETLVAESRIERAMKSR